MADFDAILRKALASRPDASGEERRKIYERARQALIRQLSGFEPPLPPEDISRQRLALESAIRKVEADVASSGSLAGATAAAKAATPAPEAPPASAPAPAAPTPSTVAQDPAPETAVGATASEPATAAAPTEEPQPTIVGDPDPGKLPDFEPERSQPAVPAPGKKRSNAGMIAALAAVLVVGGGFGAWYFGFRDQGPATDTAVVGEDLPEAPEARQVGASDPTQSNERLLPDNQGTVEEPLPEPETNAAEAEAPAEEAPVELVPEEAEVAEERPSEEEPAAETDTEVAAAPPVDDSGLPVAQTAILYEEGATPDAAGFTAPGRTIWQLETVEGAPVIVGTVEVPGRGISLNLRISQNVDDALPATHLLEFTFTTSESFPAEGIAELVGVVVKPEEQAGGDPLRGAIVDLGEGVFWQALAAGESDLAVNLPLLQQGRWFDLPILYADNRRAIISFEKGADGEQVFQQALTAWGN